MLSFCLNKNIPCEIICSKVSRLIETYRSENPNCGDLVLTININKITDSTDSLLHKLEYKENS